MVGDLIKAINKGSHGEVIKVIFGAQKAGKQMDLLRETNTHKESPLICAIKKRYTEIAKILIDLEADVNYMVPGINKTALMYAAELGNEDIVGKLIIAGAKLDLRDQANQTAQDIAEESGYDKIVEMLRSPDDVIETDELIRKIYETHRNQELPDVIPHTNPGAADHTVFPDTANKFIKVDTHITSSDVDEFKLSMHHGNTEEFIKKYIAEHNIQGAISEDIVFGLLLNTAIVLKETEVIKYVLAQNPEENNILTCMDKSKYSPISNILLSQEPTILELIHTYIQSHPTVLKSYCIEEEVDNLKSIIEFSRPQALTPKECFEQYIAPLFVAESLQEIQEVVSLIGE